MTNGDETKAGEEQGPRVFYYMKREFEIVQCALDGNIWDRNVTGVPPCQHSDAEWDAWAQANGKPLNSELTPLQRWLPQTPLRTE